ncbi:MAG TPA: hypothetical protein VIP77_06565 [Jiangellaceae bacterium]
MSYDDRAADDVRRALTPRRDGAAVRRCGGAAVRRARRAAEDQLTFGSGHANRVSGAERA